MSQPYPEPLMVRGPYVRPEGARDEATEELMRQDERAGTCPFCGELPNNRRVFPDDLFEYWRVVHNISPFNGAQEHILPILKRHIIDVQGLTIPELLEEASIIARLHREFPGCRFTTVTRSGDPRYNAMTVRHLHTHAVAPRPAGAISQWRPSPFVTSLFEKVRLSDLPLVYVLRQLDLTRAFMLGRAEPVRYSTAQDATAMVEYGQRIGANMLGVNLGLRGGAFNYQLTPLNRSLGDEASIVAMLDGIEMVNRVYRAPSFGLVRHWGDRPFAELVVSRNMAVDQAGIDRSPEFERLYNGIMAATPADFKPNKPNRELEFVDDVRQALDRYRSLIHGQRWMTSFKLSDQIAP